MSATNWSTEISSCRTLASGASHASALSLLRQHLTPVNAAELFELCQRGARKVQELLAPRFPRPDVRDLVCRLPARRRLTLDVECGTTKVQLGESPRELPSTQSC